MTPTITDDDKGTITATVDGKVVRSWTYSSPNDQNLIAYAIANDHAEAMGKAREYAEGWHNCAAYLQQKDTP